MLNGKISRLHRNSENAQTLPAVRNGVRKYICEFSAAEIRQAVLSNHKLATPLEELIATGEAAFAFVRHSEMEPEMKNAFGQLEKQFEFYKNLMMR